MIKIISILIMYIILFIGLIKNNNNLEIEYRIINIWLIDSINILLIILA